MRAFITIVVQGLFDALGDEADAELLKKVKNIFSEDCLDFATYCVSSKAAGPSAVICHGDCWNNNILYRYDEVDKLNGIDLFLCEGLSIVIFRPGRTTSRHSFA